MYPMYYLVPSPYIHNDYAPNIQRSELRKYQPSIGQIITVPSGTTAFENGTRVFIHDVKFQYDNATNEWIEFIYIVYPRVSSNGSCVIEARWISINDFEGIKHIQYHQR
ncbi:hypothetical protein [Bacillus velezensis]|uniref:hypothetical protein n=1 Tax=Bacillus velezensis TaxID=492670 RepID=UPI003896A8C7